MQGVTMLLGDRSLVVLSAALLACYQVLQMALARYGAQVCVCVCVHLHVWVCACVR